MTGLDNENDFEDFLARRSTLHPRLAEHDRIEPPPELDRIVLAKARQAIEKPADMPMYRSPPWALPVGLTATIVVTFAVALHMGRASHNAQFAPQVSANAEAHGSAAFDTEALAEATEGPPTAASPPVAAARPQLDLAPEGSAAAKGPVPASSRALSKRSADSVEAVTPRAPGREGDEKSRALVASTQPAAKPEGTARAQISEDAVTGALKADEPGAGATSITSTSPQPSTLSAQTAAKADQAERAKRADPQGWLREIERLRAEGRIADANRELAEYRKAFPSQSMPAPAVASPPTQ